MRDRISVAMATYNGEKYIRDQIESILVQLNLNDEIVISDDGSTDATINIVKSIGDERIKLFLGPQQGVKKNFENAIRKCTGKYIFLCDQDDIWEKRKVRTVLEAFDNNSNCLCVLHDCSVWDSKCESIIIDSFFEYRKTRIGILKNIYRNSYIGCCMAFKCQLKDYVVPIPEDIEMHDQWIGIISEVYGTNILITDRLIKYRRHDGNVSLMSHHPLKIMMRNRWNFIRRLFQLLKKHQGKNV